MKFCNVIRNVNGQEIPAKTGRSLDIFNNPEFIAIREKAKKYQNEWDAANRPKPPTPEQIAAAEANQRLAQGQYERFAAREELRRLEEERRFREEVRLGLWTVVGDEEEPVTVPDECDNEEFDQEGQEYE
jgi:hypothetical protein